MRVLLLVFVLFSCRAQQCQKFVAENGDFKLKKWTGNSCEALVYRISVLENLNLEGIQLKCLHQILGRPISRTATGAVYDLFQGIDSCEYRAEASPQLVLSLKNNTVVSHTLFL